MHTVTEDKSALKERSIGKEVEYVPQHAAVRSIDFGVFASRARDGGEAFALNVEYLGEEAAGSPEFADLVVVVRAFGTFEVEPVHVFPPRLPFLANASL
jgi:hypothetical protein